MSNITYIKVLQTLEAFASAHLQVKRFGADFPEQMPNLVTEEESFPYLFVSPTSSIFNPGTNQFQLEIYCWDRIAKDRSNLNSIMSDTAQILNDLDKWLRYGDIAGITLSDSTTITPLNNGLLDYTGGWLMSISIDVNTYTICEIPFDGAPSVASEKCDVVYNSYLTCDSLERCQVIIDIQEQIASLTGSTAAVWGQITGNIEDQEDLYEALTDLTTYIGEVSDSIPTNTSELINDGADGVNPFITLEDVPAQVDYQPQIDALSSVTSIHTSQIGQLSGDVVTLSGVTMFQEGQILSISGVTNALSGQNITQTADILSLSGQVISNAAISNGWLNQDGTKANQTTGPIYRSSNVILTGGSVSFNSNNGNANFGTSFGHITGSGGITGFIQLFSQGNNGGMINPIVSSFTGASLTQAQQVFAAVNGASYAKWNDLGRSLFQFRNGYGATTTLSPILLELGTDYVSLNQYPTTRLDTGTTTNYLATDANGKVQSKPTSAITSTLSTQIATLSGNVNTLSAVTTGHTSQITAISGVNNTQTTQINALSAVTTGQTVSISSLSGSVSGLTVNKLDKFVIKETYWVVPMFGVVTLQVQGPATVVSNGPIARNYAQTNVFLRSARFGLETLATSGTTSGGRQGAYMSRADNNLEVWMKFGTSTNGNLSGIRSFAGLVVSNFLAFTTDATAFVNSMCFARISTSNNWQIVHNDAAGAATVVDTGLPANTIESDIYMGYINSIAGGAVTFTLTNQTTGVSFTYSTTTDLPSVSLGLGYATYNNTNAAIVGLDWFGHNIAVTR